MKKFSPLIKTKATDLLIQVVAIIFSVLLALGVNNWRENQQIRSIVMSVLSTLSDEIVANQGALKRAYEYHRSLASKLQSEGLKLSSINLKAERISPQDLQSVQTGIYRHFISREVFLSSPPDLVKVSDEKYLIKIGNQIATAKIEGQWLNIYGEGGIQLKSANLRNLSWEIANGMQILIYLDYERVILWSDINRIEKEHDETVNKILENLYDGSGSILPILEDLIYLEEQLLNKYKKMLAL